MAAVAAARADVVITMLPAGKQVREVYLGPNGIIASANDGTLLIDCSTIDVETARTVAGAAEKKGLMMVDAPVSGGVGGAHGGTLTFMVGGSDQAFDPRTSRSWRRWARPSCMPAAPATARRRRSATT